MKSTTSHQHAAPQFGDIERCPYCRGRGYEHSRYWDDVTCDYEVMEIRCTGCGGKGERVFHEETALIDWMETRYDY